MLVPTFVNLGAIINGSLQIVGLITVYIYFNSLVSMLGLPMPTYNYQSFLWAIGLMIAVVGVMLMSFIRLPIIRDSMIAIGAFLFTIGSIITGYREVSVYSLLGSAPDAILKAYISLLIAAGAVDIVAGIVGIVASVFLVIIALGRKGLPPDIL